MALLKFFSRAIHELFSHPSVYYSMQILTRSEAEAAFNSIKQPYGVDVETNAKKIFDPLAKLVTISFAGAGEVPGVKGFQIPIAHSSGKNCDPDVMTFVADKLNDARCVPFFVQYETVWLLHKLGIRPVWTGDGYVAARIAQLKDFSLKDLTEKQLPAAGDPV